MHDTSAYNIRISIGRSDAKLWHRAKMQSNVIE